MFIYMLIYVNMGPLKSQAISIKVSDGGGHTCPAGVNNIWFVRFGTHILVF